MNLTTRALPLALTKICYILDAAKWANATWFTESLFFLKKRDLWNEVKPACRLSLFFIFAQRKVTWPTKEIRGICMQATIPGRTTWECFFVNAHYLMQQNYFQINSFTQRKPPPPGHHCSFMPGDEAFFFSTASIPGGGGGKNCYGYDDRKILSKYAVSLRVLSMILAGCGLVAYVLRPMFWGLFGLRKIKVRFTVQVERLLT